MIIIVKRTETEIAPGIYRESYERIVISYNHDLKGITA